MKNRFLSLTILGCCLGVLLSVVVGLQSHKLQEQHGIDMLKDEMNQHAAFLEEELVQHLEILLSLRDYIVSTGSIGEKDFQAFVSNTLARHPDIHLLEWIPRVFADMRAAMENAARRKGHADFQFTERNSEGRLVRAGERKEYFPVYYVEPLAGNEATLGFDFASDPTRLETLIRARDSGSAQATAGITLGREKDGRKTFLLFIPVYDAHPETVAERRLVLSGFVVGLFRIADIVEKALMKTSPIPQGIAISLLDDSAPEGEKLLYRHESRTGEAALGGLTYRKALKEMGGRRWSIELTPTPAYLAGHQGWQPYILAGALLLLTLILALYLHGLAHRAAEHERDQEALQESERRFRDLVEFSSEWIWEVDSTGVYTYSSLKIKDLLGYAPSEILGKTPFHLMPPEEAERIGEIFQNIVQSCQPFYGLENLNLHKDGRVVYMETSGVPILDDKGRLLGYRGVDRDITKHKLAEEELRESESRFRQLAEHLEEVFWLGDMDEDGVWRLLYVNPAVEKVFGITPEQEYTSNERWLKVLHEDDRERVTEAMSSLGKEKAAYDIEYRIRWPDGSTRWIWGRGAVVRDEHKKGFRTVEISQDVTQRHDMERRTALTQKLESIGLLAAGIAHEINTPTQYVGDNTRFLQDAFKDLSTLLDRYASLLETAKSEDKLREAVAEVEETVEEIDMEFLKEEIPKAIKQSLDGVERVASIVLAMKKFSHPESDEKKSIDINAAIENTITVTRNEWKYVAETAIDLDRELPLVPCFPGDLNQVILNMVVNAAHAIAAVEKDTKKKGLITISTVRSGDFVEIGIRDTGTGIPENDRLKIFDPFFTTKDVGKGTGQGLAIAHDIIVDKHGGSIHFETEVKKGTEFFIRLPLGNAASGRERDA